MIYKDFKLFCIFWDSSEKLVCKGVQKHSQSVYFPQIANGVHIPET